MPIYTNGSIFPIYLFNLLDNIQVYNNDDIKNLFSFNGNFNTDRDYIDIINRLEYQNLLGVIVMQTIRRVYDKDLKPITINDIKSNSISDIRRFILLANIKINLSFIESEIDKLIENNLDIDKNSFLNELFIYTYKYLFVNFSNIIYCHGEGDMKVVMDFPKYYRIYRKYSEDILNNKYSEHDFHLKHTFVSAYQDSFKSDNENDMSKTITEILILSNEKLAIKKLDRIITKYIDINNNLSKTKKNQNLRIFFKHITCKIFYRNLNEYDVDDYDFVERFKKFRHQMK